MYRLSNGEINRLIRLEINLTLTVGSYSFRININYTVSTWLIVKKLAIGDICDIDVIFYMRKSFWFRDNSD